MASKQLGGIRLPGWRSVAGLLLILVIFLPIRLWRASWESSLWMDEMYSLFLTAKSVSYLMTLTALDAHPPGFYLILKSWLGIGTILGVPQSVLWARIPSIVGWIWTISIGWFGGRYLLGTRMGTLLAWALAASAHLAYAARDIRNYSLLVACLTTAFMTLLILYHLQMKGTLSRRRAVFLWSVYTLAACGSLWLHLLCGAAMFWIGITWVVLAIISRPFLSPFLLGGILANSAAILGFVPWLLRIQQNVEYNLHLSWEWATPTTFGSFMGVFCFWYPFGRLTEMEYYLRTSQLMLAVTVFVLAPLVAGIVAIVLTKPQDDEDRRLLVYTSAGFFSSVMYTVSLWYLTYYEILHTFHGPRYPMLVLPIWLFSMVCWAGIAIRRFHLTTLWAWIFFIPWFAGSFLGQEVSHRFERFAGLDAKIRTAADELPPEGSRVYFLPSRLFPYQDSQLKYYNASSITSLADTKEIPETICFIQTIHWTYLEPPEERVVTAMLESGRLGESTDRVFLPATDFPDFAVYTVHHPRADLMRRLVDGPSPAILGETMGALSVALPEMQLPAEGFYEMEIPESGNPYCWGAHWRTRVHFDRTLSPGKYMMNVDIYRRDCPVKITQMTFRVMGESAVYTQDVSDGTQRISFPIEITGRRPELFLEVTHPVWRPSECIEGSRDRRKLSYMLNVAWVSERDQESENGK